MQTVKMADKEEKRNAAQVKKKEEKHIVALGTDSGGYSPRGFSLDMSPQRRRLIFPWKEYFLPYGVYDFDQTDAIQDMHL